MAGSVNKVILIGNLGADPECRTTGTGREVANLRIATSRHRKDPQTGERIEDTDWHSVVCWNQLAELAQRYLAKGRKVYVEGRLETRSWEDRETGATRYKTEVIANELTFLDSKGDSPGQSQGRGYQDRAQPQQRRQQRRQDPPTGFVGPKGNPYGDDDVPF